MHEKEKDAQASSFECQKSTKKEGGRSRILLAEKRGEPAIR
jgi:hypothetical protein